MVPRERYSGILPGIESLYAETTDVSFNFIYVDGCLPEFIREEVEKQSQEKGFRFIHRDYPLTPNEARNIGLEYVDTEYMVFTDNDVCYTPGWLRTLLDTAREYDNAWLVGPTILDGDLDRGFIHAAAGVSGFHMVNGKKRYHYKANNRHDSIHDVKEEIGKLRGQSTMLEFHTILCRSDIFKTIGKLDEGIWSYGDHDDLIMAVAEAGGNAIYEPKSVVRYDDPGYDMNILQDYDIGFFLLRWGKEWNAQSVTHVAQKWNLDPEDTWPAQGMHWSGYRRRKTYRRVGVLGALVGFTYYKISKSLAEWLEQFITNKYTAELRQTRAQFVPEPNIGPIAPGTPIEHMAS